jgi:tetratricopeptide (TPR) repeat protein
MTLENQLTPTKRFVPAFLPWLLAAGFLLVYLLTLNHWVSFSSLLQVAKASGWMWQPETTQPLNWLVTRAFHLLPEKWVPLGLNLFSALCAALTLALLARSVALLPHDRTEEQRTREKGAFSLLSIPLAWLPVLLATVVCGLQLTFWEHATAASSEMLDLLLFAYIVRCLLEYRIEERDSWLFRASLVYGLAMPDNWAMIGFFPVFLLALAGLKGLGFFNLSFLGRMFLWGFPGLLLYLLLPLAQGLAANAPASFWEILVANLREQKNFLFGLPFSKGALLHGLTGDQPLWVLGLPTLLPVLIMGIRWPSYFGDPSKLGVALTTLIFHFFHAFLLVICTWVALDPQVSPRHLLPGLPLLTFYYLGALSVGYYSGYFLLVFRPKPKPRVRPMPFFRLLHPAATAGVCLLCVAATVLLVYRNLPTIRLTNGPTLKQYASQQTRSLPARNTVLLSDDTTLLFLTQAAAVQDGASQRFLFLDTYALRLPDYHRFLKQKYPQRWLEPLPTVRTNQVPDATLLQTVINLEKTNALYYLHPSFGYYFEVYYPEPHGTVYQLKPHTFNPFLAPPPDSKLIAENEGFWTNTAALTLQPLLAVLSSSTDDTPPAFPGSILDWLLGRLHLAKQQSSEAVPLGAVYSRALDYWGVQLQKAGLLPQAAARFTQAVNLNSGNCAAVANRDVNAQLQAGRKPPILSPKELEERFGKYRSLEPLIFQNGPFDEPTVCFEQGRIFARNDEQHTPMVRQAAELVARAKVLLPNHLPSWVWLAHIYNLAARPDLALEVTQEIHTNANLLAGNGSALGSLLFIEMSADLARKDLQAADAALRATLAKATNSLDFLKVATDVYKDNGFYSNALTTVEQRLRLAPDNEVSLVDKGSIYNQLGAYAQAIEPFTKALKLDTNSASELFNYALLHRAIAYLRSEQYDAAQRDYETYQKINTNAWETYYALGEVAYHKKDTNAALKNYQLFLANCPPDFTETNLVSARLKELKPGTR